MVRQTKFEKMEKLNNKTLHAPGKSFSKLSKEEKIKKITSQHFTDSAKASHTLKMFWNDNSEMQKLFDQFSENTLSNFYIPYGLVPSIKVNGRDYAVPMAIEESSVVAASSRAAKYWNQRGGFHCSILGTEKLGGVHFFVHSQDSKNLLVSDFRSGRLFNILSSSVKEVTSSMKERGGGLKAIKLIEQAEKAKGSSYDLDDLFLLEVSFETCDAMGANFINTVLEKFGEVLRSEYVGLEVVLCILSNYTPHCIVRAEVHSPIDELSFAGSELSGTEFARKFRQAVGIASIEKTRAVTHNKGIMNGIDAVIIATGNDFRAVEAAAHAYASRDGEYRSLSHCEVNDGIFSFSLEIPLALGTVGGLTRLHPLASLSLEMMGNPGAKELMKIVAAIGLAQNFAAIQSLVTTGIQRGHMKMHLLNILNSLGSSEEQKKLAKIYFSDKSISYRAVKDFLLTTASTTH